MAPEITRAAHDTRARVDTDAVTAEHRRSPSVAEEAASLLLGRSAKARERAMRTSDAVARDESQKRAAVVALSCSATKPATSEPTS
jgi:hypothetical protein